MKKSMKYMMAAGLAASAGIGAYMYAKNNKKVIKKIKSMCKQATN